MRPPDLFELLRRATVEHDWTAAPDGIGQLLAGADPRTVGRAAAEHGVTNLLYLSARELPALDPELRSLLATVYHLNLTHHMKVIGELTSLAATLDAAGVPFMVVKGPVLSEVIYPRSDMRSYGDLDLVVDRRVFGDAITALLESGCDMLDRNWRVIRREMRGQVHMAARFGTCADVHWHLINRASVRGSFAIDMDELFGRARRVSLDGPEVLTLDPADTLL
ncbi:MAG TPA: nucleotidyltransferase family protein, partial [Gaiellales bacterium]|nr:nucleotidyltransferase family protein [Gaiellales bacterium]